MAINKVIYAGNTLIDLTGDDVTASDILSGKKAHDKTGTQIIGSCSYDSNTTDATASASEILATKTAYVNKSKVTGQMTNNGAVTGTITTKAQEYTIPQGFHDGSGKVSIDSTEQGKIIAGNIKSGVEILGVTGSYNGSSVSAQTKTVTPYTTSKTYTPESGYDYFSEFTVSGITYTETQNTYGTTVSIGDVAPS